LDDSFNCFDTIRECEDRLIHSSQQLAPCLGIASRGNKIKYMVKYRGSCLSWTVQRTSRSDTCGTRTSGSSWTWRWNQSQPRLTHCIPLLEQLSGGYWCNGGARWTCGVHKVRLTSNQMTAV